MSDVELIGTKDVLKAFDKLDDFIKFAVSDAIEDTANEVKRRAIQDIRITSAGKTATRYGKTGAGEKRSVIVSKRGDAPNSDTERLEGSIDVSVKRGDPFGFVFTELEYGFFLETVHNRPWLQPALHKSKTFMKKALVRNLTEAVKQAQRLT